MPKQNIKATVFINRHIVTANKAATKDLGAIVDRPAITIKTTDGSILVKDVHLLDCRLIQDALSARCSGATIWIETTLDRILLENKPLTRERFKEIKESEAARCGLGLCPSEAIASRSQAV